MCAWVQFKFLDLRLNRALQLFFFMAANDYANKRDLPHKINNLPQANAYLVVFSNLPSRPTLAELWVLTP